MTADFNYYINRQGIRGAQGEKGDQGFSPYITVGTNTSDTYTLHIENEFNSFDTVNLKEGLAPRDDGGTYVKYDRDNETQYYGEIDAATTLTAGIIRIATDEDMTAESDDTAVTPGILADKLGEYVDLTSAQTISGTKTFTVYQNIPYIYTSSQIVKDTTSSDPLEIITLGESEGSNDGTSDGANRPQIGSDMSACGLTIDGSYALTTGDVVAGDGISITLSSDSRKITIANTREEASIATATTAGLVKPDGTTLSISDDGTLTVIGGTGGGGTVINDSSGTELTEITLGDNLDVTDNILNVNLDEVGSEISDLSTRVTALEGSEITISDTIDETSTNTTAAGSKAVYDLIVPIEKQLGDLLGADNTVVLTQDNVTAGDNVTITNTTSGIEISATGGGSTISVDSELSTDSTNPVQNKIVTTTINEIDTAIQTNTADITTIENRLTTDESATLTNSTKISTLEETITTLQSTIETLNSTVESLQSRIATLEESIDGGASV